MKVCVAILSIVLLQGVMVNSQSTLDTIVSTINTTYQQYRSGELLRSAIQTARVYISSALEALNQLQNYLIQFQVPQISAVPNLIQQGRTGSWQPQWRIRQVDNE